MSRTADAKQYLTWNSLWLLLFLTGIGWFFIVTPKYLDDYWFMEFTSSWYRAQGIDDPNRGGNIFKYGIPWKEIGDTILYHYHEDNSRLSNILATFLLIFPKWLGSLVVLLLFCWSMLIGFNFTGIDWRKSALAPLAIFLWTFAMPWHDNFGALDYGMNYVFPAWLGLLLFLHLRKGRAKSASDWAMTVLLALLTGVSHESLALSIAAGLCCLLVFKEWRRIDVIVSIILILGGAAFLLTVPGMVSRVDNSFKKSIFQHCEPWKFRPLFEYDLLSFSISVIMALVASTFRKGRKIIASPLILFLFSSSVVTIVIHILSNACPRSLYWADFSSALIILNLLNRLLPGYFSKYNILTGILSALMLIPVYIHWGYVADEVYRWRTEIIKPVEYWKKHPLESKFGYTPIKGRYSAWCGNLPTTTAPVHAFFLAGPYYGIHNVSNYDQITVFPKELEWIDRNSGNLVNPNDSIWEKEGFYYKLATAQDLKDRDWESWYKQFMVDFGKGERWVSFKCLVFRSRKDGNKYLWIFPELPWYVANFKTIKSIRLAKPSEMRDLGIRPTNKDKQN